MRRIHAPELEDEPWFPGFLRDSMTEHLAFVGTLAEWPYAPFVARLRRALEATGARELVDLGSGGGGPTLLLARLLAREGLDVRLTLTDLYPNVERLERVAAASGGLVAPVFTPIDATAVPAEHDGFRLMCSSFHHMRPEVARGILVDAVRARRGIAILEVIERSPASLAAILTSPLQVMLAAPFLRPFRASRLLFTYVIPLLPCLVLWDGLMSMLRIYAPDELRALVREVPASEEFDWDIGALSPGLPGAPRMVYLIGTPRTAGP